MTEALRHQSQRRVGGITRSMTDVTQGGAGSGSTFTVSRPQGRTILGG